MAALPYALRAFIGPTLAVILTTELVWTAAWAQTVNPVPAVSTKMSQHFNEMVQAGANTLHQTQSSPDNDQQPAPSPLPPLKLDRIHSRYVEQQSEIYDRSHHLTWSRCSAGQRWDGQHGCTGKVRQYTFDRAQQLANETWRLPTREELLTLLERAAKQQPASLAVDSVMFPDMDPERLYYWTSTVENNSFAWAVLFTDGGVPGVLYRNHRFALRLVRSAK